MTVEKKPCCRFDRRTDPATGSRTLRMTKAKCNDDAATDDHDEWETPRAEWATLGPLRLRCLVGGKSRAMFVGKTWMPLRPTCVPANGRNSWRSFLAMEGTPWLDRMGERPARASDSPSWRKMGCAAADAARDDSSPIQSTLQRRSRTGTRQRMETGWTRQNRVPA